MKVIKEVAKSNINQHTFDGVEKIRVNGKVVVKGFVDGKRVYHIENRHPWEGYLMESVTVESLNQLKKSL